MCGYIGFTPSVRQSVRLCIPHAMSALWLVAYFHKCYRSVYAPSMLVVLVRRNEELISDCRSFPGDGYKPCLTTLTHLGRPQWKVVCIRLMPVAIFWANFDTHDMCALCRARAGDELCTTEDNCITCTSWDDITWNMFEVNSLDPGRFKWNLDE